MYEGRTFYGIIYETPIGQVVSFGDTQTRRTNGEFKENIIRKISEIQPEFMRKSNRGSSIRITK